MTFHSYLSDSNYKIKLRDSADPDDDQWALTDSMPSEFRIILDGQLQV